ncbi:MAG: modification methylase [Candidatus Poribacteria bacterium]|nr:modification methylase [Candidatus Poribacteria bacterium]
MSGNKSLHAANKAKQDEFYTQLSDIEKECKHYRHHFRGKTIYCNCDDPIISNFYRYFSLNFAHFGLKKLITTCYKNQQYDLFTKNDKDSAVGVEYIGDDTSRIVFPLNGNGDFRNPECIEILKKADVVVTNPPFSLFREYVAHLVGHEKQFLIIGIMNAVTYKEIFPLIKNGKMWLGYGPMGKDMLFDVPEDYAQELIKTKKEGSAYKIVDGVVKGRLGNASWFTNLDHDKRNEELILYKKYSPKEYQKYDNYDAIEVSRTMHIPRDYGGEMGVPISFLDKFNPNQFEIIGIDRPLITQLTGKQSRFRIKGKEIFARIVIRNKRIRQ